MKITTNDKLIARNAKIGKWASLGGMAILGVGLFASFKPELVTISFICLLIGFILANFGTFFMGRWVKEPRPDQVLSKALKGFSNKYHLFNYTLPADHVLLSPNGLFIIRTKLQDGVIFYQGKRWYQKFNWKRILRLFVEEGLGNPAKEVAAEIEAVRSFLAQHLPDQAEEIPIQGLIVFTHPDVQLDPRNSPLPAVTVKGLKPYLRQQAKGKGIPERQRKELEAILSGGTK